MSTAQERFNELVRDHLAPGLRKMGFKGSGQEFIHPDDRYWVMIGIQRSSFSDRSDLRFTVQLNIVSKQKWEELRAAHTGRSGYRERPYPTRFYGSAVWSQRLGQLFGVPQDKWWVVKPESDVSAIAAEVEAAFREFALPAIVRETR